MDDKCIHTYFIEKKNGMYYAYNFDSNRDESTQYSYIDSLNTGFIVGYVL